MLGSRKNIDSGKGKTKDKSKNRNNGLIKKKSRNSKDLGEE